MIAVRYNPNATRSEGVKDFRPEGASDNLRWLELAQRDLGPADLEVRVLLFGGADRVHFELRVAQAGLRHDRLPSFFSHAALLAGPDQLLHVPLAPRDLASVPQNNGIDASPLKEFESSARFPNLALLAFPCARANELGAQIERLRCERLSVDLVSPLVAWFGYVLGAGNGTSPLATRTPIASALFVDEALSRVGVDVAPGLVERAACPEAIWQAVLWWADFYQRTPVDDATARLDPSERAPRGRYWIRNPHATVND